MMLELLETPPERLFWSEPHPIDSDFTAEDPLALDYLGQQVGLWLFGGLTTRTSRAQYYAAVLYGLWLVEQAVNELGYAGDDKTRTRLFERWERFWALATLEYRKGELSRGDADSMRGVRGATRAWFPGPKPLPREFQLISRQSELGGLGAYLTSLRAHRLVFPGSLRVTPAAMSIIDAFWGETRDRDTSHQYRGYALEALAEESQTIPRKRGLLTLRGLGKRSRLSCLTELGRTKQQDRLWQALFVNASDDSTLPLAHALIAAEGDGVDGPEALLSGLLAGRWGVLPDAVRAKVAVARAFGRAATELLGYFDRVYGHVEGLGRVADIADVASASLDPDSMQRLRACGVEVLESHEAQRFGKLQYHGPGFVGLLRRLQDSDPGESLEHLLHYHRVVQRSRRGGGPWLVREQDKLVMRLAGYNGYKVEPAFPGLKLGVVRQLLRDLGRLS